jgi:hypothetical protein
MRERGNRLPIRKIDRGSEPQLPAGLEPTATQYARTHLAPRSGAGQRAEDARSHDLDQVCTRGTGIALNVASGDHKP